MNITGLTHYLRVIHIQTKYKYQVWLVIQSPDETWHLAFFDNGQLSIIDEDVHILVGRGADKVSIKHSFGDLMPDGNFEIVGEHPDISCIPQCLVVLTIADLKSHFKK